MNNKFIINILFILLLFLLFCFLYLIFFQHSSDFPGYESRRIVISGKSFNVYISDTDEKRYKGLSESKKLKSYEGMMFVWEYPDYRYFWMKDMSFSLDFVYIRDNVIVDTIENITPDTFPKTFSSLEKANWVIEFPAGTIKKYNIHINSKISTTLPK